MQLKDNCLGKLPYLSVQLSKYTIQAQTSTHRSMATHNHNLAAGSGSSTAAEWSGGQVTSVCPAPCLVIQDPCHRPSSQVRLTATQPHIALRPSVQCHAWLRCYHNNDELCTGTFGWSKNMRRQAKQAALEHKARFLHKALTSKLRTTQSCE
jgi:hypothetical protein